MDYLTSVQVAAREGCAATTARKWAKAHGLAKPGRDYIWTEADIVRFREREKPGRRWPEKS
jgi:hypothetical protein